MTDLNQPAPALDIRYNGECVIQHLSKAQEERLREAVDAHYPALKRDARDEYDEDGKYFYPSRLAFHIHFPKEADASQLPLLLANSGIAIAVDTDRLAAQLAASHGASVQAHSINYTGSMRSEPWVGMTLENLTPIDRDMVDFLSDKLSFKTRKSEGSSFYIELESAESCIQLLKELERHEVQIAQPKIAREELKRAEKEARESARPRGEITM